MNNTNSMVGKPTTVGEQVACSFGSTADRIEALAKSLADRLLPILEPECKPEVGLSEPSKAYPQMFEGLRVSNERINNALDDIQEIINRLAI